MKQEFKNIREVATYLRSQGWKVSQSTVYKHSNEGRINTDKDGVYTIKAVENYAKKHLKLARTRKREKEQNLQDEISQENLELLRLKRERETIKLLQDKRQAILREE